MNILIVLWRQGNDTESKYRRKFLNRILFTILWIHWIDIACCCNNILYNFFLLSYIFYFTFFRENDDSGTKAKALKFWMANTFSLSMKITSFVTKFSLLSASLLSSSSLYRIRNNIISVHFYFLDFNIHMIILQYEQQ